MFWWKKAAEMQNKKGAELGTPGLHLSIACDLWSFKAIYETEFKNAYAYLNSFIMFSVNDLVT